MRRKILSALLRVSLVVVAIGFAMFARGEKHKVVLVSLEDTEWKLVWVSGAKIEDAAPLQVPYIQLQSATHHLSGSGGCNRLMGGYDLSGNSLKFTQIGLTRMACLHGGNTESAFVQALHEVSSWKIANGGLALMDADQHVLARFKAYKPDDGQQPEPASAH